MKLKDDERKYLDGLRMEYIRQHSQLLTQFKSTVEQSYKDIVDQINELWNMEKYFMRVYHTVYWFNRA